MTKLDFLKTLHEKLSGLPENEVKERLDFYCEMIEDHMEEGLSEEDAVDAVGTVEEIAAQIVDDIPLSKIAKAKIKPSRRLRTWETLLLIVGSPLWFSLLVAAFAVALSLYVSAWSVAISLWAVFASVAACVPALIIAGIYFICTGYLAGGLFTIGGGLVCAGLAPLLFLGCKAVTNGIMRLTKKILSGIKKSFVRKGDAQ